MTEEKYFLIYKHGLATLVETFEKEETARRVCRNKRDKKPEFSVEMLVEGEILQDFRNRWSREQEGI